jgi:hypothetical protein
MAEFVIVVQSFFAVVTSSVIVERSLTLALNSAFLIDPFLSFRTNVAEIVILVLLIFRAFSAFVIIVVRETIGAAFLSNFNFSLRTLVAFSVIIDFSRRAFNAFSIILYISFRAFMANFTIVMLFFWAVMALFVVEVRLI